MNTTIYPFGQSATIPAGYPIADDLNTDSAQMALSAKQGKILGDELHHLKILVVGNSFSRDSLSYVPPMMERLGYDVEIGILYRSSGSLQMHWENRTSVNYYTFNHYTSVTGAWSEEAGKGLAYGIAAADWDAVILQQNSSNSMDYTTYQPYLNDLIAYISESLPNVHFWWLLTHAWAEGYQGLTNLDITSDQMAQLIETAAKSVYYETACDLVLPYGKAIQMARQNPTLNAIGVGGGMCFSDKVHLQEGIGCQIAAYANALAILRWMGSKKTMVGDTLLINSTFLSQHAIPEQHGQPVGSTTANCQLGQRYAEAAINSLFEDNV